MSANKKKVIVLCSMVALLVVTGVLNFVLGQKIPTQPDGGNGATITTFFSSYRADRESGRAEEIAYLDSIISSESASATAKSEAETQKNMICQNIEKELILEGLIKSQGFEDAVVTMSTSNCNIIIKDSELTADEVSKVLGVIVEETSYKPTEVVVVPYNK